LDGSGEINTTEPVFTPNPFTYTFVVPNEAESFELRFGCSGLKQISATVSGAQIVYPDDIQFTYAGLQVGSFRVDRSGNIFANAQSEFNGGVKFKGGVSMNLPLPVESGGMGANTAAGARTNIGAAAASDVTHVYRDVNLIGHPLDTSSYVISFETVGKNVYITFRGDSRAHTADEVFMEIPEGYRSGGDRYFPAAINNTACGVLMQSNGNVSIWTNNPASGRIFLAMSYCIE
jgi:hypothetical protein